MRAAVVHALVAAAVALTGCAGEAPSAGPAADRAEPVPTAPIATYVAIGDSYTSGAGTAGSPTHGCRRSPTGYPGRVAAILGATYTDASCSGARTEHVTHPQPLADGTTNAPQLDRVAADTDLVTIGLGFNDRGFLRNLTRPGRDRSRPVTRVTAIARDVAAVVQLVRVRAPQAEVVVVGYPQLVPVSGTCPQLPLTRAEYPVVRTAYAALSDALADAAARVGATFVDVAAASVGHDVCAGRDAWVNGGQARPGRAAPYHPFAREQVAVAALVADAVR